MVVGDKFDGFSKRGNRGEHMFITHQEENMKNGVVAREADATLI